MTASGMVTSIGKDAGSDDNRLIIMGTLVAGIVEVGSVLGNEGNTLEVLSTATLNLDTLRLAELNFLSLEGDFSVFSDLENFLGAGVLEAWNGVAWLAVDSSNESTFLSSTFDGGSGFTTVTALPVPEPQTYASILGGVGLLFLFRRRVLRS